MRIIAFGDIHGEIALVNKIEGITEADYIIVTGDLTNWGGIPEGKKIVQVIQSHNPNVLALTGNMDQKIMEDYFSDERMNLHGNGIDLDGIGFFGVGGSPPTPFGTPNEWSEEEIETLIYKGYEKIKHLQALIMVSHSPPHNTNVDEVGKGVHVGSKAVRSFIETHQPELCLTGHIHEAVGSDKIGNTYVINPGMFNRGGYVEVHVNQGQVKATLKKIKVQSV